jgi:predicted nuclease of predicted toxin-antitoxin system
MRFLADECCDVALVQELRADGHNVLYAMEFARGATDEELLERAFAEGCILVTEDKDFGELVYQLKLPAHGIVLLRFATPDRSLKLPRLRELLKQEGQRLPGSFVTLEPDKVRIRPLI